MTYFRIFENDSEVMTATDNATKSSHPPKDPPTKKRILIRRPDTPSSYLLGTFPSSVNLSSTSLWPLIAHCASSCDKSLFENVSLFYLESTTANESFLRSCRGCCGWGGPCHVRGPSRVSQTLTGTRASGLETRWINARIAKCCACLGNPGD